MLTLHLFLRKKQVNWFYCCLDVSYLRLVHTDQPVTLSVQSSTLLSSKAQRSFWSCYLSCKLRTLTRSLAAALPRSVISKPFAEFRLQSLSVPSACLAGGILGKINPLPILGILFQQVGWPARLCG